MRTKISREWDLISAVQFAREVEQALITNGFHVALGGSVLHTGYSTNDVDLFIYPHEAARCFEEVINKFCEEHGWATYPLIGSYAVPRLICAARKGAQIVNFFCLK